MAPYNSLDGRIGSRKSEANVLKWGTLSLIYGKCFLPRLASQWMSLRRFAAKMCQKFVGSLVVNENSVDSADGLIDISVDSKIQLMSLPPDLINNLKNESPTHMIHSAFIPLWNLPLTVFGKPGRKHLAQLGSAMATKQLATCTSSESGRFVGPEQSPLIEMETRLVLLWAKTINIEAKTINATDNFFKLGADSIITTQLVGLQMRMAYS